MKKIESDSDLGGGHHRHGGQHQEPPADDVPEDQAYDGGDEVGDAYEEGAVLGGNAATGGLKMI